MSSQQWSRTLSSYLPWTSSPLLISAPMGGFAWAPLATAVSLAGGLGLIGSLNDMSQLSTQLSQARSTFAASSNAAIKASSTLPLGVGILAFICKIEDVVPVIREFKPAVVWLFAAKQLGDYRAWVDALRGASPETRVWIQVGNVEAALYVANHARPDAICLQGADAGGHGFEKGAGVISLVPEAADALRREGFGDVPLLASGGIVDGRGVAAALALGAAGVVMGTRFLASREVTIHPVAQAAVVEAEDGGQVTKRSKLFDQLKGPNVWPEAYDGRSLVVRSYEDYVGGVGLEEIQRLHNEAVLQDHKGYATGRKGRAAIWAGTGVGIVREVEGAADIIEKVRREAKRIMSGLGKL
ncbi:inosine monophosphate dehydrogenase [Karstenula rhodostoma CBS 690.94]|uniref:Inosine monophosphate dehydrogenase n=1 Tax=Karstenula rhodostoma CBS 690.94 TaxID=1392251 RepID=A0A9P4P9H3_9PLEO|nr:inosine monophosphate dehydrogenase [Karstenula rhodostoma CBS 690.94]